MNKVILIGRLTKDPELKDAGNTKVVNASIAVDRVIKREGRPEVDFIPLTIFGKTAEFVVNYMRKGSKIAVEGSLQNDTFTDKEGKKRTQSVVLVNNVEFAGPRPNAEADATADVAEPSETDEIPFA